MLSSKYDQKLGNKIADKITKVSRTLPQISLVTVTNEAKNVEHDQEIP